LSAPDGDLPGNRRVFDEHQQCLIALRCAIRFAHAEVAEQAVTVLHQGVRAEAQLSFASLPSPLRAKRASGSVVDSCVWFERCWP
jgi:hypothetical protein